MTPYDWPSQYGMSPLVSTTMWHVSPVAFGPTMRSTDTILPLNGFLLLKVFIGRSPFSSSIGTLFFFPVDKFTATSCALICTGLLAGPCCLLILHWTPEPRNDCACSTYIHQRAGRFLNLDMYVKSSAATQVRISLLS